MEQLDCLYYEPIQAPIWIKDLKNSNARFRVKGRSLQFATSPPRIPCLRANKPPSTTPYQLQVGFPHIQQFRFPTDKQQGEHDATDFGSRLKIFRSKAYRDSSSCLPRAICHDGDENKRNFQPLEAQLPIYSVPVLKTLYKFVLSITQRPTIWAPGLLGNYGPVSLKP